MTSSRDLTFGHRLRLERERLSLTQAELGARGGVKKLAQHLYESDARVPSAQYLVGLRDAGVDVTFVLFGVPSEARQGPPAVLDQALLDRVYENVEKFGVDAHGNPLPVRERSRLFGFLYAVAANAGQDADVDASLRQYKSA
jgi:transcriptional regulator with XRE-family HTH domain